MLTLIIRKGKVGSKDPYKARNLLGFELRKEDPSPKPGLSGLSDTYAMLVVELVFNVNLFMVSGVLLV